jgi:hypothetical protein
MSAAKQQERSLFKSRAIEASAAGLRCCQFAPVPRVALFPCFLMEKKGVHLHSQAPELIYNIHEYFKSEAENKGNTLTKQFVFSENNVP